jgi:hypothetical protein
MFFVGSFEYYTVFQNFLCYSSVKSWGHIGTTNAPVSGEILIVERIYFFLYFLKTSKKLPTLT